MIEAIEVFPEQNNIAKNNNDTINLKESIIDINNHIENDIKQKVRLLTACLDNDLKNYEALFSIKKIGPQLIATLLSLGIGVGSLLLFDQESNDFAKNYLKAGRLETILISSSCDYANLILGAYTSYKLIHLLFDLGINKQVKEILSEHANNHGNQINHSTKYKILLVIISAITAIPLSLPIHNNYKKMISFICNAAINLYSFVEARMLYNNNFNVSHYDEIHAAVIENIKNYQLTTISNGYNIEHISRADLSDLIKISSTRTNHPSRLKYLRYSNMFISLIAVVPYFLALYVILNKFFGSFNVSHYINLILSVIFSAACNLPIGLLGLIFSYFLIDLIKDLINIKNVNSISKAVYPKTYFSLGLLQMLATFFSWTSAAKLFLDYFEGPDLAGLNGLQLAFVYTITAIISLGIYEFVLYPNLQMINTAINFMCNYILNNEFTYLSRFSGYLDYLSDNLTYIYMKNPELFTQLVNNLSIPQQSQTPHSSDALLRSDSGEANDKDNKVELSQIDINVEDKKDKKLINKGHFKSLSQVQFFKTKKDKNNMNYMRFDEEVPNDSHEEENKDDSLYTPSQPSK